MPHLSAVFHLPWKTLVPIPLFVDPLMFVPVFKASSVQSVQNTQDHTNLMFETSLGPWLGASTPMDPSLEEKGFDAGFADVAALKKDWRLLR